MLILEKMVSLGEHWNGFLEGVWEEVAQSFRTGLANVLSKKVLGRVESVFLC